MPTNIETRKTITIGVVSSGAVGVEEGSGLAMGSEFWVG